MCTVHAGVDEQLTDGGTSLVLTVTGCTGAAVWAGHHSQLQAAHAAS